MPRSSAADGSAAFAVEASATNIIDIVMPSVFMSEALLIIELPIHHSAVLALRGSLPIRFFNSDTQALTFESGSLASDK